MEEYENQAWLQIHKGRIDSFIESNKAMIDYSKMALRGTFMLNGGAIIAIVTAKASELYCYSYLFALGAGVSVAASCFSYLTQECITRSWEEALITFKFNTTPLSKETCDYLCKIKKSKKYYLLWHRAALVATAISLILFIVGGHYTYQSILDRHQDKTAQQLTRQPLSQQNQTR